MALRSRWSFRTLVAVLVTLASMGSALAVERSGTQERSSTQTEDPTKPIPW